MSGIIIMNLARLLHVQRVAVVDGEEKGTKEDERRERAHGGERVIGTSSA